MLIRFFIMRSLFALKIKPRKSKEYRSCINISKYFQCLSFSIINLNLQINWGIDNLRLNLRFFGLFTTTYSAFNKVGTLKIQLF